MSNEFDWIGQPRTMYRKRRLKKIAKRCGLDPATFRVYAKGVKRLRQWCAANIAVVDAPCE